MRQLSIRNAWVCMTGIYQYNIRDIYNVVWDPHTHIYVYTNVSCMVRSPPSAPTWSGSMTPPTSAGLTTSGPAAHQAKPGVTIKALSVHLGREAARCIARDGWDPALFNLLLGASGGPKWFILGQLDRFLFGDYLQRSQKPLAALGSSIGSWRHACLAQADPNRTPQTPAR